MFNEFDQLPEDQAKPQHSEAPDGNSETPTSQSTGTAPQSKPATAYTVINREPEQRRNTQTNPILHNLYAVIHFYVLNRGDTWAHVKLKTKRGERDAKILLTIPRSLNASDSIVAGRYYVARIQSITTLDMFDCKIKTTN